jgi:hypothetical protein
MVFPSGCKKNTGKMGKSSVPVLSAAKPWFSPGSSHIGPIALTFCAYPCMSMPAGAAPGEIIVSCAALAPKNISVSRQVSRQSCPRTLVFPGKTCGFVVEVVGFESAACAIKKTARSFRIGHPTDLLTPCGLGLRFCWQGRNQARLENDLFLRESRFIHST